MVAGSTSLLRLHSAAPHLLEGLGITHAKLHGFCMYMYVCGVVSPVNKQ